MCNSCYFLYTKYLFHIASFFHIYFIQLFRIFDLFYLNRSSRMGSALFLYNERAQTIRQARFDVFKNNWIKN